jgi:putative hydrolase of the HAD superfamily
VRGPIEVVGLDADDTLWHSEVYFERVTRRFHDLVGRYVDADVDLDAELLRVERANVGRYGYGFKAFTLSMLECAMEVTAGAISIEEVQQLLRSGQEMLDHPVHLIEGVDEVVTTLAARGLRLVIVTKGDLHHQERKVLSSGLTDRIERIEIVSEKDPETYRRVVASMGVAPDAFCMVGNSVKSDVLPALAIGARAVHIPYHITWAAEHAEHDGTVPELGSIGELPGWLADQH